LPEIIDIGAARRDPKTNTVLVQAKGAQIGQTADDAPGFDDAPIFGALGITAIPWKADDRGNAQGIADTGIPGHNAVITSIRDARAAGIVEELSPGETAIHSTGPDFDAKLFLKKQLFAAMVGDDCAIVMDRENQRFTVSCFGMHFEMSAANGCVLTSGGATLQLMGPTASLMGQVVLGGRIPMFSLLYGQVPGQPVTGMPVPVPNAALPAMGVFIGI
jgi:hypothetical protein